MRPLSVLSALVVFAWQNPNHQLSFATPVPPTNLSPPVAFGVKTQRGLFKFVDVLIPTLPVVIKVVSQLTAPENVVVAVPCPILRPIRILPFVVYCINEWIAVPVSWTAISVLSKHSINNPAVLVFQLAVPPP